MSSSTVITTSTTAPSAASSHTTDPSVGTAAEKLRAATPARVGLGRVGAAIPTKARLDFLSAHAGARDAVHTGLDVEGLVADLRAVGVGTHALVRSQAATRQDYLLRPDLGRLPQALPDLSEHAGHIGIVLADGLSPTAVAEHGPQMYAALAAALPEYQLAAPVIATQARVALGDHIGHAAGWDVTLVLIGERPGLSVPSRSCQPCCVLCSRILRAPPLRLHDQGGRAVREPGTWTTNRNWALGRNTCLTARVAASLRSVCAARTA